MVRCKTPIQADKILAAAAKLFATHRFHEARMEDIAALAEVGKGTLYRYFKDKDELYVALLQSAGTGLMECLAPCHDTTLEARRRLVLLIASIIDYFDAHPHLFDLITHAEAMYRPGHEFPWQDVRRRTLELAQEILQTGVSQGQFHIGDLETTALVLLGGIRAVLRFGVKPRPENVACQIAQVVVGPPCKGDSGPNGMEVEDILPVRH